MKLMILASILGAVLCAQVPAHYDHLKAQARATLDSGNAAEALAIAATLAQKAPDDIEVQYTLAKAQRLLGRLTEAEKTTQWMLDLRPEFVGGLHEAALLREAFKDLPGAVDLLNTVYRATPATRYKERSEILSDLARIFDKQDLKKDSALLRNEIQKLKGLEISNAKATATPAHK